MRESQPTGTAHLTAVSRAAHQILDGDPKILSDPLAVGFVLGSSEAEVRANAEVLSQPMRRRTRSGIVVRSRFAEDQLCEAVAEGARQYLILGAGFDTFAYRQPEWAADIAIVEIDHPVTQAAKRRYLQQAGIDLPANVSFGAVDFERMSIVDGIAQSAFDPTLPTFVSWLGVTMYLTRPAIEETLHFVLSLPSPSRITFSFFAPPEVTTDPDVKAQTELMMGMAAELGEPMITFFEPEELAQWLLQLGFAQVFHLSVKETRRRYLANRTDDLPVATSGQNISAWV
jgi:methyltransferase (TIGR00027 family)